MSGEGAIAELTSLLAPDDVVVDAARMSKYLMDRSETEPGRPMVVARPGTVGGVSDAVRWAAAHRVPVVPRGAGSGLSGGATAIDGCLVLSLERLRGVHVDAASRTVVAEAGAITAQVKEAAAAQGLWYPPDPSSYELSSIGGNVATNAGGLCCLKYGVTGDYVLGLEVVLADGGLVTLGGPLRKDVAGLDVRSLFVGSEGTLGVVVSVTLRLLPAPPLRTTVIAYFRSTTDAANAIVEICRRWQPSLLELMDQTSLRAVESAWPMGLDTSAGSLLIAQFDDGDAQGNAEEAQRVATRFGADDIFVSDDVDTAEALLQVRRLAVPALERLGRLLLDDVGVPLARLPHLFSGVKDIGRRHAVETALVAHAGDGNTHPILVLDPRDDDQRRRAWAAYGEIMDFAVSLGGTITGEHGVGRLKAPWLPRQLPPATLELQRRVKMALDPLGIMNPGAIFSRS